MPNEKPLHRKKTIRLLTEQLVSLGAGESDANQLSRSIGLARSVIYELTKGRIQGRVKHPISYLWELIRLALKGKLNPSRGGSSERLHSLTRSQFDAVLENLKPRRDDWDDDDDDDDGQPVSKSPWYTESKLSDYLEQLVLARRKAKSQE